MGRGEGDPHGEDVGEPRHLVRAGPVLGAPLLERLGRVIGVDLHEPVGGEEHGEVERQRVVGAVQLLIVHDAFLDASHVGTSDGPDPPFPEERLGPQLRRGLEPLPGERQPTDAEVAQFVLVGQVHDVGKLAHAGLANLVFDVERILEGGTLARARPVPHADHQYLALALLHLGDRCLERGGCLDGVRELADIVYLTNEYELGDFGVGGLTFTQQGFQTTSKLWTESLFRERGIRAITGAHVTGVEEGIVHYEQLDGTNNALAFDFAMLLPPFRGVDLRALDRDGEDISAELFAPNGFMKVDADYTAKPFEEWRAEDWPRTYQVPRFPNIFAVGIAFAPPHQISRPRTSPHGTVIAPSPSRTGMPSGIMGKLAATNIAAMIAKGDAVQVRSASMADMAAACVASAGSGLRHGSAASMTMYPVVPDVVKYPGTGRSLKDTFGEIGLAGHWIKLALHYLFIYKAKARPGWHLIPE